MRGFLLASLLLLNGALFVANWLAPIDDSPADAKMSLANVPSIQLISELSPQQLAQLEATQPPPAIITPETTEPLPPALEEKIVAATVVEKPVPASMQCYQLGPFHSEEELIAVRPRLAAYPLRSEIRQRPVTLYWVHLQKPERVEDIDRQIVKLRNHGINDTWVSSGENYNGSISLGLFKTEHYALNRKKTVGNLGFKVEIEEHKKPENSYWLTWDAETETDGKTQLQSPLQQPISRCATAIKNEDTQTKVPDSSPQ